MSNDNNRYAIHRVIAEEEEDTHNITSDAHNVIVDNFSHISNTQRDNANEILTSEKQDKSDDMAETLKGLTINNAGYYESGSANANDANGDPASDPEVYTHTSDGKKRKVTDSSNEYLQQKLSNKRTLLIINTTMDPQIDDRVATYGASPHKLRTPQTMEVITDAARKSAQVLWTPRCVSRTGRTVIPQVNAKFL